MPLLIAFVQAVLLSRGAVKKAGKDPRQLQVWERSTRVAAALATRLRLSPQARVDPKVIARHQPQQPLSVYDRMKMGIENGSN